MSSTLEEFKEAVKGRVDARVLTLLKEMGGAGEELAEKSRTDEFLDKTRREGITEETFAEVARGIVAIRGSVDITAKTPAHTPEGKGDYYDRNYRLWLKRPYIESLSTYDPVFGVHADWGSQQRIGVLEMFLSVDEKHDQTLLDRITGTSKAVVKRRVVKPDYNGSSKEKSPEKGYGPGPFLMDYSIRDHRIINSDIYEIVRGALIERNEDLLNYNPARAFNIDIDRVAFEAVKTRLLK